MLIRSLKMENFRQFKGTIKVAFSCDSKQNVTIILGDNSFGKTTILQAFNWCFYGKTTFKDNPNFLLNKEVEHKMLDGSEQFVRVTIELLHNDIDYTILREQKYTWINGAIKGLNSKIVVSHKKINGQTEIKDNEKDDEEIIDIINNILPEGLSTYFFFDTERVDTIATRQDLSKAVKDFLGLSIIENAISHIGEKNKKRSVIGKLFNSMDRKSEDEERKAKAAISVAESKIKDIEVQITNCKKEIKKYEQERKNLEDFLNENKVTSELQSKRKEYEKELQQKKQILEEKMNSYFKEFNRGAVSFFSQPFITKAEEILKNFKNDETVVPILNKSAISKLIESGECICGRKICKNSEAYNNLMNKINVMTNKSSDIDINNYHEKLKSFSNTAKSTYHSLKNMFIDINKIKDEIYDLEDKLKKISEKIKNKTNMRIKEEELSNVKARIKELDMKKDLLHNNKGIQVGEIDRNEKILEKLIIISEKNKQTQFFIDYAEKVRDWFNEFYKKREIVIRKELEEEVNVIFEKMYHGSRHVVIDTKYQVELLTDVEGNKVITGESEGLNRVKSFAFIAGLISIAKKKIINDINKEYIDLSSEPYPLVMDAPFSNADEMHIANISKVLPEIAEQVIMFVMQKDWNYAEPVMRNHVGKEYQLKKINETLTKLSLGENNV